MTRAFNPYQAWLGLDEQLAAPNHFELLGLDVSQTDPKVIAAAADRAASRVRAIRPGSQTGEWARLLDQIAEAKRCLTDPASRGEYLNGLRAAAAGTRGRGAGGATNRRSARPSEPSQPSPVDPNMFPPGLAPAMGPMAPVSPGWGTGSPMAPVAGSPPAPTTAAMQPYSPVPGLVPAGAAPVPYLKPADSPAHNDPMHPVLPGELSGPAPAGPSPMAPVAPGFPGAPAGGAPFAGIPVAIPIGVPPSPPATPVTPQPSTPFPAPAVAAPYPGAPGPGPDTTRPAAPGAVAPLAVNKSSAAMLADRHTRGGALGPIALGGAVGLLLLGVAAGLVYWNADRGGEPDGAQVAAARPADPATPASGPAAARGPFGFTPSPADTRTSPADRGTRRAERAGAELPGPERPAMTSPSEPETPSRPSEPAPGTEPPPTTTAAPTPPAPDPATATPAKMEDLPAPTKEELAKLGLAFQKARQAIGEHNFDRAAAFLEVAGEMPRLPEHQAMLERLLLLSDCVAQYRAAIAESLGKLAAGSSFDVGETKVGVVETSPQKIIFRVNGQNRSYTLADLPVGLAAALAAQTLADDDPQTLTLKGAFVLASPKATDDEKKKAQEFLEEAARTVDAAKELLVMLKDQYNFGESSP